MRPEERPAAVPLGAFPADPGFPQLEVACDPTRMLEVFRAHLKAVPDRSVQILDCAPFRFRCRQSDSRCVLQFTLRLLDPGNGRQWLQWATGLLYAGHGEAKRHWEKFRAGDPAREMPEPWESLEPASFIPELDMFVEVFPFDRRLPHLSRVLNGASRDIGALLLERLGPGRWQAVAPIIEPTRYRAELGAVLRYTLLARDEESGRYEAQRCYLKVYRDPLGGDTFDRLRSWLPVDRGTYALVQPIAYFDDLRTLVLEEAQGTDLRHVLVHGDDPEAAARAVARALVSLHRDDLSVARTRSASDRRQKLAAASALVQWACPEARARVAGVAAVAARNIEEAPPALVHGDLGTDRVFIFEDRVTLLGAEDLARGDPVADAALLFSHIEGRVGLDGMPPERAHAAAAAFAEEYFRLVPLSWSRRFRWHCAAAFIEGAAEVFRSQEPGWRERVVEMAASAQRAMAGAFS